MVGQNCPTIYKWVYEMATKELTSGQPLKLILEFMFPIFIGNLFQQLYNFADAVIVGRYVGIKALAAVGTTAPLIFFVISFIFASTQGFTVVLAQRFGARDYDMVRKSFTTSVYLSGGLMILMTFISTPFTYQMLSFLRTPSDIIDMANIYLFIMFAGIFATVFYNLSSNVIRALGDSKTPLYFLIFSSILNIFLALLFVVKFKIGVAGAGCATVLSQFVATILCVSFMFWKFPILHTQKEDWKIDKDFMLEHLRIGIPMGFQMSILTLGILALQYVLNGLGSIAVAAYTTAMRVDQIFSQVFVALGATMATFTAQNFGANKMARIKQGAKSALGIVITVTAFAVLVLTFFSQNLIQLFMSEPNEEVIKLGAMYLHIIMIFFIFLGLLLLYRNILQGMGQVVVPLLSGTTELIMRTVFAFAFGLKFGFLGICFATPAAWFGATVVLFSGYKISLLKILKNRRKHV